MSSGLDNIWNEVLNLLKVELTEVSFNTWLKTIEPVSISKEKVILAAPNAFTRDILIGRYLNLIKNALNLVIEDEIDIQFILKGEEVVTSQIQENPMVEISHTTNNNNRSLGKTHLMQAIGHFILGQNPNSRVVYVSSEKFTNELINSIREYRNEEFRNKYRNIDVLLIDDIQFIAGKDGTQEEFFHTFNALHEANKQIIISSDRPPKEIPTLEDRLRSRFEWGLITDIQAPDLETRIAILRKKANLENIKVSDEVMSYIASKILSNIRELEGALIRVVAYSSLTNSEVSVDLAEEALKDILSNTKIVEVNVSLIKEAISKAYKIKIEDFESKKRTRAIAYPRQIAMYLTRELTDLSLPKIGDEFGGRDHTTVIHAYDKISEDIKNNIDLKRKLDDIVKNLKEGH